MLHYFCLDFIPGKLAWEQASCSTAYSLHVYCLVEVKVYCRLLNCCKDSWQHEEWRFPDRIIMRKGASDLVLCLEQPEGYVSQIPVSKSSHNIVIKCDVIILVVCGHDNEEVTAGKMILVRMWVRKDIFYMSCNKIKKVKNKSYRKCLLQEIVRNSPFCCF